jgi:molybdopterin-synthase adenylyltransferase
VSTDPRYARHMDFFGAEGQARIVATHAAIVGVGGLGGHVAQQLAYLGVTNFTLIDADTVSQSNLNRLIGAGPGDIGTRKVDVTARLISSIQPGARVATAAVRFAAEVSLAELAGVTVIFGCVDGDAARLELVRFASAHALPYIDLASDIAAGGEFGGRVVFAKNGERCLSCLGELDQHALARSQMTNEQRAADDSIYGVERSTLDQGGPSVVSINGAVASLAVTEYMAWTTGLREPFGHLNYRGDRGTVGIRNEPARIYCAYCMTHWGTAA